ncbi:hypothetical protein [Brevibacterium litoralis]|uniref:hypothetical protein n=1 Tax=Brevibacterium litoralis TaxID=3138935 RepID=UPI0032F03329
MTRRHPTSPTRSHLSRHWLTTAFLLLLVLVPVPAVLASDAGLRGTGIEYRDDRGRATWYGSYNTFAGTIAGGRAQVAYCVDAGRGSPRAALFDAEPERLIEAPEAAWALHHWSRSTDPVEQAALSELMRTHPDIPHRHRIEPVPVAQLGPDFSEVDRALEDLRRDSRAFAGPYTLDVEVDRSAETGTVGSTDAADSTDPPGAFTLRSTVEGAGEVPVPGARIELSVTGGTVSQEAFTTGRTAASVRVVPEDPEDSVDVEVTVTDLAPQVVEFHRPDRRRQRTQNVVAPAPQTALVQYLSVAAGTGPSVRLSPVDDTDENASEDVENTGPTSRAPTSPAPTSPEPRQSPFTQPPRTWDSPTDSAPTPESPAPPESPEPSETPAPPETPATPGPPTPRTPGPETPEEPEPERSTPEETTPASERPTSPPPSSPPPSSPPRSPRTVPEETPSSTPPEEPERPTPSDTPPPDTPSTPPEETPTTPETTAPMPTDSAPPEESAPVESPPSETTPGVTPETTPPPAPAPTSEPTPSSAPTPTAETTEESGPGSLPITGARSVTMLVMALLLIGIGVATLIVTGRGR